MDRLMADTEDEEEMIELEVDGSNDVTIDAVVQVEAGQPMNTSAVGMLIVDGDYLSDGNGTFHNTREEKQTFFVHVRPSIPAAILSGIFPDPNR